jgi:hypothetical protein
MKTLRVEAVDWVASTAGLYERSISERRKTMSEETKKVEKIEQEAKQEVKPNELSEQDLEQVAGGAGTAAAVKNKQAEHKSV